LPIASTTASSVWEEVAGRNIIHGRGIVIYVTHGKIRQSTLVDLNDQEDKSRDGERAWRCWKIGEQEHVKGTSGERGVVRTD
jgi:hypothetical protein